MGRGQLSTQTPNLLGHWSLVLRGMPQTMRENAPRRLREEFERKYVYSQLKKIQSTLTRTLISIHPLQLVP